MKKKTNKKLFYVKPKCSVEHLEIEAFICTSVYTNPPYTTEVDWDQDQDIDAGQVEF